MIDLRSHALYKKMAWCLPGIIALLVSGYATTELIISGLIPGRYVTIFVVIVVLYLSLVLFLLYKEFKSKKLRITYRAIAIFMAILIIMVSIAGLYILKRGLSTLDKLSDGVETVQVDTQSSFNLFISGIDTYGDISTQSRSDVNIVASVNPETRHVLLTTVPRDSYVKIALGGNDQYDKLTHAGNYGVESSMQTVANLLDTDIDVYIRINFSSFVKIIDALGGITVYNPTAFSSNGESFAFGNIELDGDSALIYSRERKSLSGGDVDRGKNQQRVIDGVIQKISQIRSVDGFNALLNTVGDSVQSNVDSGALRSLINQQLSDTTDWTTDSYSLEGKGQTGGLTSYAMPNSELYMYVLDDDSVAKASKQIDEVLAEK